MEPVRFARAEEDRALQARARGVLFERQDPTLEVLIERAGEFVLE